MRKHLRNRIVIFSFFFSLIFLFLTFLIFLLFYINNIYKSLKETNQKTLQKITCNENTCDIYKLETDGNFKGSDYVLTKDNFFIYSIQNPDFWLNFVNTSFFEKFRKPTSYLTPSKETYRLLSRRVIINNNSYEVMVGWLEKAPYILEDIPASLSTDLKLIRELNRIEQNLSEYNNNLDSIQSNADGYLIVNLKDGSTLKSSGSLPVFYRFKYPVKETPLFINSKKDIYFVKTDFNQNISVISLYLIGNLISWTSKLLIILFITSIFFYYIFSTYLRKYFLIKNNKFNNINTLMNKGEGHDIEFKRGLTDDEVLKTITSFANSNDGVILIGVDDKGHIVGNNFSSLKEKDLFIQKIFNLSKNRIKPTVYFNITFEKIRDYEITKIFVPRGEELLYYLDGIIYIRYGSSDIKPSPDAVKKIISENV